MTEVGGGATRASLVPPLVQQNRTGLFPHHLAASLSRRVASGVLTLLIATMLIFIAVQVLPGDVASVVLGRTATPERLAAVRQALQLDDSLPSRYFSFLGGLLTGHLGDSTAALVQGQQVGVASVIEAPLRNSLVLALITTIVFVPVCLLLGSLCALRAGRLTDRVISSTALALGALPEFVVGTLLIVVFFTLLNVLPPVSTVPQDGGILDDVSGLVLPVLTLLAVSLAFGTRLLRASMIDILNKDYVAIAHLRGFSQRRIVLRYVLRNALAPSVQILAQMIQWLVGGIIVTENVFNFPGIGTALVQAVNVRDVQETMVIATILATIYIGINIVADFVVVLLVPKLRTAA